MAAIHQTAFPPAQAWDASTLAGLLAQPGVFGLIDARGGMALVRVAADEAELLTLAVMPAARRQAIGAGLLDNALRAAAARGAASMVLEVAASNDAARVLYASRGFAPVGRRAAYYGERADAIILRAVLPLARRRC